MTITSRMARMLDATSPVLNMIDALHARQDERNRDVFEMAARLRDAEPDLGEPMRNQITGGVNNG